MVFRFALRKRRPVVLALSICILCNVLIFHKTVWSAGDNDLTAYRDENDNCARFENPSSYREYPDYEYEQQIDSALLAIQREEESKSRAHTPVKQLWQIWRDNVVPEKFDQPAVWRKLNPDWEHNVCYTLTMCWSMADLSLCADGIRPKCISLDVQ